MTLTISAVISLLLMVFFMFAGSIKLLGWQKFIFETQLSFFKKYGLNRAAMFTVGLVEFSAALLLLISMVSSQPKWQVLGASLIAVTSVGALGFHFKFDKWTDAIPAAVTLLLSLWLLALSY
ncbi:DoxX family protein [Shewanella sp. Isolate13]|uniref:DoxX family protein n=1 Tax=Shewanella sp. Isolate13 TaxID=2908531 RepID=UPI001EFC34F4|nr:DoxX family protein [Shewanella sp. Isolate13]MCG9731511.1 DoxX family protein [Shewanella sp. Isolate13]